MSSDKLFVILDFTGVVIGGTQTLSHGLKINGQPLAPDMVWLQYPDLFEVTAATTTSITVHNVSASGGATLALCQVIHPIMRSFGSPPDDGSLIQHMTPQPFVVGSPNATPTPTPTGLTVTAVQTANVVLTSSSNVVRVNPTGGAFSVTLPAASTVGGQSTIVKNVSSSGNLITVLPGGGDTIDGLAQATLSGDHFKWWVISDGASGWMIVG